MMVYRLAVWLTKWFIAHGHLKEEDYDVYVYCIDSLLAKIVFYITLGIVAWFFDIIPITIGYYMTFIAFRYTAGGYHAKTELGCAALSWAVYAGSMYAIVCLSHSAENLLIALAIGSMLFAVLVAIRYAPIDHFNKPVSSEKKQLLRKCCLCFQVVFVLVIMLLLYECYYSLAVSMAWGNGVAALFLLIAHYQKRREEG